MIHTSSPLKNKINLLLASEKLDFLGRKTVCELMDELIQHYQRKNPHELHGFCTVGTNDPTRREYY